MSCTSRKLSLGFPTRSDTNQVDQPQKMDRALKFRIKDRALKFRIKEVEGLYYLCSENKGAGQLPRSWSVHLFLNILKEGFSHDVALILLQSQWHHIFLNIDLTI